VKWKKKNITAIKIDHSAVKINLCSKLCTISNSAAQFAHAAAISALGMTVNTKQRARQTLLWPIELSVYRPSRTDQYHHRHCEIEIKALIQIYALYHITSHNAVSAAHGRHS